MLLGVSTRRALGCVIALVATTSCASLDIAPHVDCTPQFPYAEGWLGADAAYSIPLRDGRSIWLFGDTFVGKPGQTTRSNSAFIHNSIAVSRCEADGSWSIDYAWGESESGTPRAFFDAGEESGYWWLFDGFEHAGSLYIGLLEVEASEPRGRLNLPFRPTGMKLARIGNYRDAPERWRYDVLPLTRSNVAFPGSAMVIEGEYVYLFSFFDRDEEHHPRMLARLPLVALEEDDPSAKIEYFAVDRRWRAGFDPDHAQIVMDDNASEMSVRFLDELGAWIAVYNSPDLTGSFPGDPPSNEIRIRTSKRLEGPWSNARILFRIPELEGDDSTRIDPNTFCYAAKEHPQYQTANRLLITYVCNLFTPEAEEPWAILSRLLVKMELYRPRVVSISLPELILDYERYEQQ